MLACAYFDEDGNVMVTNEGTLPSQKIAKRFTLQVYITGALLSSRQD